MHRLAVGIYDDDGTGKLVRVHREELDIDGERTEVPALDGVSRGKLILVNDDDLTYCSLRLDPESLETALTRIADIAEPLPRTLVWSAAWEMTREAELRARDFVALVVGRHSGRNRGRCGAAAAAAGADRAGLLRRPGLGVRRRAGRRSPTGCWSWPAPPSPDRTTSWPTSTRCARRCCALRHVAVLAALLDTDPAELGLAGLTVDTDLRWRIVTALAAAGDIDADGQATPFIDAEVERDPTAAGKRNAARAAAARPQLAVKEAAWQLVIEDDTLANIVGRAIIDGFVQPGQQALLQPFTARYFDAIPRRVGATVQRGRADGGDRPVPVVGHQRGRHWPPPTGSWPASCRRRCAGWCSRAAQASNARCGPEPSTSARRARRRRSSRGSR